MLPAVLATKLFVPVRRPDLVARRALTGRLDGALLPGRRLTLVSAPAGFGKTTLLGDWVAGLPERASEVGAGWLSLDEGDNDLPRLLAHLLAALERAGLALDATSRTARAPGPASDTLTALVNDVAAAGERSPGRRWVLVLDDCHVVDVPEVHQALTFLLDHLPDALHLVVATRSDPPWPLARLRSRGQLTEVRAADLRFTPQEADDFLTHRMGLDLAAGQVGALEERTEGWVAGLQLAALSLRDLPRRDDVARFVEDFAGSDRFVIDYLADEVLARQPDDVRDFLLRTAVLDRLTGPACDAVTGRRDGGRTLEALERGNLFLVPLDTRRTWYRYHHLFADVLRARLLAEHPDLLPALHRAAGEWHAAQGLVEDAVRHALAAGDHDRAAHLVEEALPRLRRDRQDGLLLAWMRALPEAVVRRRPVLAVVAGWARMMAGDPDGAGRCLDDAEAALAAGSRDPGLAAAWADTEDLRRAPAEIPVHRAALAQARGDVPGMATHARRALDLAAPDDHFVRGAAGGFLGLAAWARGDVAEASSTFADAVRSLHAAGNLVDALDGTVVLADLSVAAGRPGHARHLYEQALDVATSGGEPYPRATADLHVGLAELDRERGDLDRARDRLERARVLRERGSISENRHRWFVATAQLRATLGDHDGARHLLDRAQALYRHGFYPDVRPIPALRARLDIARGDLAAAGRWALEHDVTADGDATYLREYDHLTLVRLLLARHRLAGAAGDPGAAGPAPLDDALALLDRLRAAAAPARAGSLLEIGVLAALAEQAAGRPARALAELGRALARAPEPEGYARLLLDEGAPMLALLHQAARAAGTDDEARASARHARRLLALTPAGAGDGSDGGRPTTGATGTAGARSDDGPPLVDPLSDRELDVLRLLDSDLTGPEIARALFVSINTLRTHTRRIFTKLGVTNRSAAVRRARRLGLL